MKLISVATLLSTTSATLLLSVFDQNLTIGQTYTIEYLMNQPYTLELDLVQKGTQPNIAWTQVKQLFEDVNGVPCNGSYTFTVDNSWPTSQNGELYALWIDGMDLVGSGGYADLTGWFSVNKA